MLRNAACIASLVGALAFASPALAAKGGQGSSKPSSSSSSIALVQLTVSAADATAASAPHHGDLVTFDVATTDTASPYVNLKCYQDGELVSEGWEGFFDGALGDRVFGLYSPRWTGGGADCTASLMQYTTRRWKELASTSFHVES